jgi:hypothetical protein
MVAMTAKTALTGNSAAQYSFLPMMRKWFTAFILIAVITGSTVAGVHRNTGAHHCPMMGMSDCCETAGSQATAPVVSAARLCCALNCTEPGTTGPSGAFNISSSMSVALHVGVVPPAAPAAVPHPALSRSYPATRHQQDSHPAYIRHLALLI